MEQEVLCESCEAEPARWVFGGMDLEADLACGAAVLLCDDCADESIGMPHHRVERAHVGAGKVLLR